SSSIGNGEYCACLSSSTSRAPRSSWAREAASRSDADAAHDSRAGNWDRDRLGWPATFFMALVWAAPPTRDTDRPTLMAGRTPELNRSVSRKICPSVIEMTLVGLYAEMSLALVSTIGSPVREPFPISLESFAHRS